MKEHILSEYILTKIEVKVLLALVIHKESEYFKTSYDLTDKKRIVSRSKGWETLKKLRRLGYIYIRETRPFQKIAGKYKKYYGLTFKGLIFLLKEGKIPPEKGHDARVLNKIPLPRITKEDCIGILVEADLGDVNPFVVDMEETEPGLFYDLLRLSNPAYEISEGLLPLLIFLVANVTLAVRYLRDPKLGDGYIKDGDLVLDNVRIKEWERILASMMYQLKAVSPEHKDEINEWIRRLLKQ